MLDPEILEAFKEESHQLMEELNVVVEKLEEWDGEQFPSALLEEFAGKIDRIMGTAKTLLETDPQNKGLALLGKLGELCKATGYKAAAAGFSPLIPIFAGFWADTVEVIEKVITHVEKNEETQKTAAQSGALLQNRLTWLAKQVEKLVPDKKEAQQSQSEVDALLESLLD